MSEPNPSNEGIDYELPDLECESDPLIHPDDNLPDFDDDVDFIDPEDIDTPDPEDIDTPDPEDIDTPDPDDDDNEEDEEDERDREIERLADYLPKVGPVRAEALYDSIGGLEDVLLAGRQELAEVDGFGERTADHIYYPVSDRAAECIDDIIDDDVWTDDPRAEPVEVAAATADSNVDLADFQNPERSPPRVWDLVNGDLDEYADEDDPEPVTPPEWAVAVIEQEPIASVGDYDPAADAVTTEYGRYERVDGDSVPDDVPRTHTYVYGIDDGYSDYRKWRRWSVGEFRDDRRVVRGTNSDWTVRAGPIPTMNTVTIDVPCDTVWGMRCWVVRYVPDDGYTNEQEDEQEEDSETDDMPCIRLS
jgi:hypothetical protein